MEQTGGKWMSLIGAYMIVKGIVNLILGFSVGNIVTLLISGVLAFLIIKGVPYMNYVTGAYLALMSVIHIIPNIQGHHWFIEDMDALNRTVATVHVIKLHLLGITLDDTQHLIPRAEVQPYFSFIKKWSSIKMNGLD